MGFLTIFAGLLGTHTEEKRCGSKLEGCKHHQLGEHTKDLNLQACASFFQESAAARTHAVSMRAS